ncbi:MAG TPA: S-methyl-5-thioribose-1-phosphate isomerase [Planctomycetota bacterium]|nr:S-methyl-5-thioribose-1-phosphate isomerase [Planctomycetota bacterium]
MSNAIPLTLAWTGRTLRLLDQTRLPAEEVYLEIETVAQLEDAILRLAVRGAPAIGCAGAFGTVLAAREAAANSTSATDFLARFDAACAHLAATRPTAVNLRWAVERCRAVMSRSLSPCENRSPLSPWGRRAGGEGSAPLIAALEKEALAILEDDRRMCAEIGRHGADLLESTLKGRTSATLMTHCNAGALATGGSGTALAVMYEAQRRGIQLKVFADETRPLLQGARLTAWELSRAGIATTVICDNMAAAVMRQFKPDAIIVGADRIAANGDAANKIGTYGLAILARHHGVPFFVAAPSSTYDLSLETGAAIPIEERARKEIAEPYSKLTVPHEAAVFNPAFDVTPAELISAHITEKGVFKPPYRF